MTIERVDQLIPDKKMQDKILRTTERYMWALPRARGDVVDIACGTGYGTMLLAGSELVHTVVGMDVSEFAIETCKKRYRWAQEKVVFLQGDACEIMHGDTIVCFETIEHLKDPNAFLQHVRTVLRKDGLFLLSIPDDEKPGHNPHHLHCWNEAQFRNLLGKNGFSVKELWHQGGMFRTGEAPPKNYPKNLVLSARVKP